MKTIPQILLSIKTIKRSALILFVILPLLGQAQLKLGDNAQNVDPNVILELESTNKGILIPRMSENERNAAFTSSIPNGLLIYNTTQNCFQFYQTTDNSWSCMGGGTTGKLVLSGTTLSLNGSSVELPSSSGELKVENGATDTALITLGDSTPITLKAGANITLTESDNTITVIARSSGGGGGGGATGPQGPPGPSGPPGPKGDAGSMSDTDSQTITGVLSGTQLLLSLDGTAATVTESIELMSLTTTPTTLTDADGDTHIRVDDGTDPDTISFTVSGTEYFKMDGYRLEVLNSDLNVALGISSLQSNRTGNQNSALGSEAGLNLNTASNDNTFIGYQADTTSGTLIENSTALGANAVVTTSNTIQLGSSSVTLVNTSGTVSATAFRGDGSQLSNVSIGLDVNNNLLVGTQMNALNPTQWYEGRHNLAIFNGALQRNITGYDNIALGENSLNDNTTGFNNIAMGVQAMTENTTGIANIAMGYQALYNSNGSYNVGMGSYALSKSTTGLRNIAIGNAALSDATGSHNTSVGAWSLDDLVNGSGNTALGSDAGGNLNASTSNNNTFIGYKTDAVSGTALSNATALGANAQVTTSNTIQLGDTNVTLVNTTGMVSATAFRGDGSQLTNLPISGNSLTDTQTLLFATSTSTTQAGLEIENGNALSLIVSGTLSLVNTDSSTLTLVSTATHGQLIQVTEGGKTGYRLLAADHSNHGDTGTNAIDLSTQTVPSTRGATGDYSLATGISTEAAGNYASSFGQSTRALGTYAVAMGYFSTATASNSFAMGYFTNATGEGAIAMGRNSTASQTNAIALGWGAEAKQPNSIAIGQSAEANSSNAIAIGWGASANHNSSLAMGRNANSGGEYSVAMGRDVTAETYGQTTLGYYNTAHPAGGQPSFAQSDDRLFVIGNGTSAADRSDAMVILKNGNVGIGDSTPTEATLVVSGTIAATGSITAGAILTPDYVFEKFFMGKSELNPAYEFPSLEEVEAFVKENHHLPNIPSAAAVEEQGGIVLNRASELQLEKIEELFLHTITQQKQIRDLEESNKEYQSKLQKQETLIQQLAKRLETLEKK